MLDINLFLGIHIQYYYYELHTLTRFLGADDGSKMLLQTESESEYKALRR